jgi:hypothetical protein
MSYLTDGIHTPAANLVAGFFDVRLSFIIDLRVIKPRVRVSLSYSNVFLPERYSDLPASTTFLISGADSNN